MSILSFVFWGKLSQSYELLSGGAVRAQRGRCSSLKDCVLKSHSLISRSA